MPTQQTTTGTRSTVEELLRRLGAGDLNGVAALYADNLDWSLDWPSGPPAEAVPWIRNRASRADVLEHFTTIARHNRPSGEGTTIEGLVTSGPDAFVTGVIRNESLTTGRHYAARFALHLKVIDGLIVQHHIYEDSLSVHLACAS